MFTNDDAMRQASDTVHEYLIRVVESLDKKFGEGYAKKNPALVGQMISACVEDFKCAMRARWFQL